MSFLRTLHRENLLGNGFPKFPVRSDLNVTSKLSTALPEGLIDLKTAGALVGVDPRTVRNWITEGSIQGWLLNGRRWRVQRAQVMALVRPATLDETGGAA
ncbi:helix-turn-helix domain-containing protein [Nocardia sp. NPDC002869]|uniref:helix-turn-helix domain-containing protein n=1 Tax=Nocardia sp. NPDC002869 TaxID=3161032 RepID=UPI00398D09E6